MTGQAAGFTYTDAKKNKGITWEEDILRLFAESQNRRPWGLNDLC
jgi:cytochrome c